MTESSRRTARANAVARCRERRILIPTIAEQRDPSRIDPAVRAALPAVDLQAVDPLNLFRITWHNDVASGGFGPVNTLALPPVLTGIPATVIGLVGARFPTGAHKVGAAFGCLVPRLVSGEYDPTVHRAVWPSTGNYCRGGAFDSALLGCRAVAILPEEMSQERFDWLRSIGAEVIATPGCESNVKEIFDACWELKKQPDVFVFNQFDEFGNYLWHYGVTAPAVAEAFAALGRPNARLAAWVSATGSGGTLAAGDRLKQLFPGCRITAAEALQCPTLYANGFGGHRIEGIGDKHVPFIHNVRNTDVVAAIDDEATMCLFRLFNEPAGHAVLLRRGVPAETIAGLHLLGISCVCNLLAAIKTARMFEFDGDDVIFTSFTDSAAMYQSRLAELETARGPYNEVRAEVDFERYLLGCGLESSAELRHEDRKKLHNLKYFTWVEQQGRTVEELNALWSPAFWTDLQAQLPGWDEQIAAFNADTGVLDTLRHAG